MKQFSLRSMILCAALSPILFSCGSNDSSTTNSTETDTTSITSDTLMKETPAPSMATSYEVNPPYNLMIVTHKVADYGKFKASYDREDSLRQAFGIHSYVIARMIPDSNTVMVAVKADDLDKAKEFSKSPGLKAAMKNSGIIGAPEMQMYKAVYDATNSIATDTRVIRNVTVKDWDAWKKSFESDHQLRMDNGIEDRSYGYDAADNHKVMVVLALTDTAKANALLKSDDMKKRMADAGVIGNAKVSTIHIVERY